MLAVHRLRKKRLATRTSIDFLTTQSSYETNFRLVILSLRRQCCRTVKKRILSIFR